MATKKDSKMIPDWKSVEANTKRNYRRNLQARQEVVVPDHLVLEEGAAAYWRYEKGRTDGAFQALIAGDSVEFTLLSVWLLYPEAAAAVDPTDSSGARSRRAQLYRMMRGRQGTPDEIEWFWRERSRYPSLIEDKDYCRGWLNGAEEVLARPGTGQPAG